MQIFTIGHSNHVTQTFINLLKQHGITAVADVRSFPFSRHFPQFNQALLKHSLQAEQIAYVFLGEQLGARPQDPSCYVDGKAKYERIAATPAFATGLTRLCRGAVQHRIALMCAEQDPLTCHRAILVGKHLKDRGLAINHILKNGDLEPHEHLEARLLKLNGLQDGNIDQLELFSESALNPVDPVDPVGEGEGLGEEARNENSLIKAYRLQGEKIAYVEKKAG